MGYEIEFLPVGDSNGDAICIRYGTELIGYTIHVVDGGYTATGKVIIDHIEKHYNAPSKIDHVVLSHADNDHVSGLLSVVEHFEVGTLWMNRPWLYASEIIDEFHGNYTVEGLVNVIREKYPLLVELEDIAHSKNIPIREVFAYEQIGAFTVLAPSRERYLSLIPQFSRTPKSYVKEELGLLDTVIEVAKAVVSFFETWGNEKLEENPPAVTAANESSVVQLGKIDGHELLLTADVGPIGLDEAADVASQYNRLAPPIVVQVPHHGSRRNVTPSVLNRWLGDPVAEGTEVGVAMCSVGNNKPEYPRKRVSNAYMRRGYPVYTNRKGWIRYHNDMPARPGMSPISPIPFATSYEE